MKEILLWGISSAILFVGFIGLLLVGFITKRRELKLIACLCLLFSLVSCVCLVKKSHDMIDGFFSLFKVNQPSRNGNQVYSALFGEPLPDCVEVVNYEYPSFPLIDEVILLQVRICPKELDRILSESEYMSDIEKNMGDHFAYLSTPKSREFDTSILGDSVIVFSCTSPRCSRYIYSSLDSTVMMCIDY